MKKNRNLCYNCFQERETPEGPCPRCGFDLAENEKKFPVALRAGTVLDGRYIVGRVLGQGGFGITYLALDTQLNAKVAIKEFMPGELATRVDGATVSVLAESKTEAFTYGAERFQEEARTLAKFIGNPNIAAVTSYFDENDTSYFVMDYIEGISFKTYIANHGGRVSVEDTLNVMIPVLRALTAVHQEGFIHRDVTPDNIYITKDGMVKLLDFGSARYSIGDKSKSLDVILKVGYAPKEQYIRRSRQGPFTDVYSCAACFYAALTGFLPPESLERLDNDTLVPVSQCGIEIPEYLDKAILKGLAVQPEDRFQSAAEFLEAIESRQVVEVPGNTPAQSATSPEKKKVRPALIAGIAAAVVVVLGIGIAIGGGGGGTTPASGGNPITEALAPKVTIAGQEYSTAVEELDFEGAGLTNADLAALSQMTHLKSLNLSNNPDITDLSPLSDLTTLQTLQIRNTGAVDLSPLSNLKGLQKLYISNPDISDLSPLSDLTNLVYLMLDDGNQSSSNIVDLSPLSSLVNLQQLMIPSMPNYTDFSPLSGMTQLRTLIMMGIKHSGTNSIDSLEFVRNMTQLEELDITVRDVDLSPLENAVHLRRLNLLTNTYYGDSLAIFSGMTDLEELVLRKDSGDNTKVLAQDLSALSGSTKLRRMVITLSGLETLSGIETLTSLEELELDLRETTLTTLAPMAGLSKLREFYIYLGGEPSGPLDIGALEGLTELQSANIHPGRNDVINESAVDHVPDALVD